MGNLPATRPDRASIGLQVDRQGVVGSPGRGGSAGDDILRGGPKERTVLLDALWTCFVIPSTETNGKEQRIHVEAKGARTDDHLRMGPTSTDK